MTGPGQSMCVPCSSSVDFQHLAGQGECKKCPYRAVAAQNYTSCECEAGYYAVPFGDYTMFQELGQGDSYEHYLRHYIEADPMPEFDPNELLDFWCVTCPEGADCTLSGTTLDNVQALKDYFKGLDGVGDVFFNCLNEHCSDDGECDDGYTGFSCTSCEEGLVLTDGFICEECPATATVVIMFLLMLLLYGSYVAYKVGQKHKGKLPSETSVFYKIMLSTCQVNSTAVSFAFDWDTLMQGFLDAQGALTSAGTPTHPITLYLSHEKKHPKTVLAQE